jgi:sugar phosphate isomerase/epimerase
MMRLCCMSLSYQRRFQSGEMDAFRFLETCRSLNLEAASFHIRNLGGTDSEQLKKVRRAYLDEGLGVGALGVTTDFGVSREMLPAELDKAKEAIRVAMFLGAPTIRVFAGSPPKESEREEAFKRAIEGLRLTVEAGAEAGLPISLQNHNHGALARTGDDVLRFVREVNHPNLAIILDTGQFAGSRGASAAMPEELKGADFYKSISQIAPLARYVRAKVYSLDSAGREQWIDYERVFNILRSVHYHGLIDIVYEGERDEKTEVARAVRFLRPYLT